MTQKETQDVVKKQTLTAAEIAEIAELVDVCNAYEGLRMRLSLEVLRSRSGETTNDFLYYADGKLAGYLYQDEDSYGTTEQEPVGMVRPEYRRKGIFSKLTEAAKKEAVQRGVEKFVFICERKSLSGQAFLKAIGAHYDMSEHEMVLGSFREKGTFDDRLRFRKAGESDQEAVIAIVATDRDNDEAGARRHVLSMQRDANREYYLATFGDRELGCDEPIGVLRLDMVANEVGIYGFVVLPEYRGRGYGRQMLEETLRMLLAKGQREIMLDVETENANALGLYLSCGFEIRATYDYYGLMLA